MDPDSSGSTHRIQGPLPSFSIMPQRQTSGGASSKGSGALAHDMGSSLGSLEGALEPFEGMTHSCPHFLLAIFPTSDLHSSSYCWRRARGSPNSSMNRKWPGTASSWRRPTFSRRRRRLTIERRRPRGSSWLCARRVRGSRRSGGSVTSYASPSRNSVPSMTWPSRTTPMPNARSAASRLQSRRRRS